MCTSSVVCYHVYSHTLSVVKDWLSVFICLFLATVEFGVKMIKRDNNDIRLCVSVNYMHIYM